MFIGRFIITGTETKLVVVRAIGPSLPLRGALELHDGDGTTIASNDNWKSGHQDEINATNLAPQNDAESAIVLTVNPGAYTAIVRGVSDATGVALVEAYQLGE